MRSVARRRRTSSHALTTANTTGTLRNVSPLPPPSALSSLDLDQDVLLPVLLPVIASASLEEASAAAQRLVQTEAEQPRPAAKGGSGGPGSDHKAPETLELERIEARLRAVQLALEILTGVCATLPDPDLAVEEEEVVDGEEKDDAQEGVPPRALATFPYSELSTRCRRRRHAGCRGR
jgi:hypothetical protein